MSTAAWRGVGVALLAVIVAAVGWASTWSLTDAGDRINGDVVGMDSDESFADYQARTAAALAAAPGDQPAFALVTFAQPQDARGLAAALDGLTRVDAMVVENAIVALPEPIDGEDREDVFSRAFALIDASLDVPAPDTALSVVVWDTGDALRELTGPEVAAVDVLPPDAAWQSFGIRSVTVPGVEASIY